MKKIITGIITLCFIAVLALEAFAGTVPFMEDAAFQGDVADGVRIFDAADLLTPEEEAEIEGKLQQFEAAYGQRALIVTDTREFSSQDEADMFVDGLYQAGGIGENGVLLYVTPKPAALMYGSGEAERFLTDTAQDQIFDSYHGGIWNPMAEGDYYTAFSRFADSIGDLYAQGVQQNQYNYNEVTGEVDPAFPEEKKPFLKLWQIIVSLLGSAGIAIAPVKRVQSQYAMEAEKRLAQGVSKAYRATANFAYTAAPAATLVDKRIRRQFIPRAQAPDVMKNSDGPSFGGGQTTIRPSSGGGTHTSSGRGF